MSNLFRSTFSSKSLVPSWIPSELDYLVKMLLAKRNVYIQRKIWSILLDDFELIDTLLNVCSVLRVHEHHENKSFFGESVFVIPLSICNDFFGKRKCVFLAPECLSLTSIDIPSELVSKENHYKCSIVVLCHVLFFARSELFDVLFEPFLEHLVEFIIFCKPFLAHLFVVRITVPF